MKKKTLALAFFLFLVSAAPASANMMPVVDDKSPIMSVVWIGVFFIFLLFYFRLMWGIINFCIEAVVAKFYFRNKSHTKKLYLYVLIANLLSSIPTYDFLIYFASPKRLFLSELIPYLGEFVIYLFLFKKQSSKKVKNAASPKELFVFSVLANSVSLGISLIIAYLIRYFYIRA